MKHQDVDLAKSAAAGHTDAFAELCRKHTARLVSIGTCLLEHRSDAEDLVQDVLVEAWQSIHQYDENRGSVGAWLAVRLRSRAVDRQRRRMRRGEVYCCPDRRITMPPRHDDRMEIEGAMRLVSAARRHVLIAYYVEGRSTKEIANDLGVPRGTVKSRMRRGLETMRRVLGSDTPKGRWESKRPSASAVPAPR